MNQHKPSEELSPIKREAPRDFQTERRPQLPPDSWPRVIVGEHMGYQVFNWVRWLDPEHGWIWAWSPRRREGAHVRGESEARAAREG